MRIKGPAVVVLIMFAALSLKAQNKYADSLQVAAAFKALLSICKNVNFADPKTKDSGTFYRAAPYIIYRGEDKMRKWKDFARYNNPDEKKAVDEICYRINESVNRDNNCKIVKYFTEKESEGTWHVLMITYMKKGVEKNAAFAFLKAGNRFGLGDTD